MTRRHLNIFLQVCKEGSITRAAEKLFMTQPAVSLAIKELEKYYKVKLFDRISHKIFLTIPGKLARSYAEQILQQFNEMECALSDQNSQEYLHIGSSAGTLRFAMLMKGFENTYSNITSHVHIDNTEVIIQMTINNDIDVGIIEGAVSYPELHNDMFAEDELVIICSPDHPLAAKQQVRLEELAGERFLFREKHSGTRSVIDTVFEAHGLHIVPIWESTASQLIIDAVLMDIGISILPRELIANYEKSGDIHVLEASDAKFKRVFSIIYRKDKFMSRALKSLIDYFCSASKEGML